MNLATLVLGNAARRFYTEHPSLYLSLIGGVIVLMIWRRSSNQGAIRFS